MEITTTNLVIFMAGLIAITAVIMVSIYAIHREHQGDSRIIRRLGGELLDAQEAIRRVQGENEQLRFDLSITQGNRAECEEEATLLRNKLTNLTEEISRIQELAEG